MPKRLGDSVPLSLGGSVAQWLSGSAGEGGEEALQRFESGPREASLGDRLDERAVRRVGQVGAAARAAVHRILGDRVEVGERPEHALRIDMPEPESIDLLEHAGSPVLKRAVPVVGVIVAVLVLWRLLRRRK